MSWQETALDVETTHNNKIKEHGKLVVGRNGKSGWSIRDTAKLLKISATVASEYLRLARMIHRKPLLMGRIRTKQDALSFVRSRNGNA